MALDSSTEISLLRDDAQSAIHPSDASTGTSFNAEASSNPALKPALQICPDSQQSDSVLPLTERAADAWLDSRVASVEIDSQTVQSAKERSPKAPQYRYFGIEYWISETINAILLLVMIIATVITLRIHDGQPIPEWPLSITINALISTYAFVFKGSMALILISCVGQLQWRWYRSRHPLKDVALFQDAGRSPYGAFKWLYMRYLRQPVVALAALVTIFGIALDPFFQQLSQLTSCNILSAGEKSPSIPRTNVFQLRMLPTTLQPALASGYYQPPNLSGFYCSTGNCTFDTSYSTLAFCSKCKDLSDQIEYQTHCSGQICNHTTAVNSYFSATFTTYSSTSGYSGPRLKVKAVWRSTHADIQNTTGNYEFIQGVDYGVIYAVNPWFGAFPPLSERPKICDSSHTNNTWSCRGYGVAQCSIQPCVRTYTADINSFEIHENLTESTSDIPWARGMSTFSILDKHCITEQDRTELAAQGYDLHGKGRWLPYKLTGTRHDLNDLTFLPVVKSFLSKKCVYIFEKNILIDMFDTLSDTLEGEVDGFSGPQQIRYLYDSGNINMTSINAVFESVAQTLTVWTRLNGDPNYSEPILGQAFHRATCIQASWAWLALPAITASLTLLVLALTVFATHRSELPVWKSSPLALLLHGPGGMDWVDEAIVVHPRPKENKADLRTENGMRTMAARIWVSLEDGDAALRLRQVGSRHDSSP